jgi:5-methylcytosine-specific restriction protein A
LCCEHWGTQCAVCGTDFEKKYGCLARGFIHVHHLKPLADQPGKHEVDPKKDLRPVCPNCHAVVHLGRPEGFTISEVRSLIAKAKQSAGSSHAKG